MQERRAHTYIAVRVPVGFQHFLTESVREALWRRLHLSWAMADE